VYILYVIHSGDSAFENDDETSIIHES